MSHDPPIFDENYNVVGRILNDSHKRKWKILEEHRWYNLDIMSLDQKKEKTSKFLNHFYVNKN